MYLDVTSEPSPDDIDAVREGLSAYNLAQVPELMMLPDEEFNVVLQDNHQVVAGAICNFDWGCLYFDTVWTDETVRGKGYGRHIVEAAHSYARMKGVTQAYLMTTSFQARPFYEKLGYICFGTQDNRPRGHRFYYMQNTNLVAQPFHEKVSIESPPKTKTTGILEAGLLGHIADYEPLISQQFAVFLRDETNSVRGGLSGYFYWDWFDLRYLWVDDTLKGQGWGKKLLQIAEVEVRERSHIGIVCDTASFQSLPFYQAQGFDIIATMKNRPPNYESYFIEKRLL